MSFSTRRGRPRAVQPQTDFGTPELQRKRSHGLTTEPLDLCLARQLISPAQHWCGMHWRWLYTLCYGAPSLTSRYEQAASPLTGGEDASTWRIARADEYRQARRLLQTHRRYDPVMRLAVFNELPCFLHPGLQARSWECPSLCERLVRAHKTLCEGLELLAIHWRQIGRACHAANAPQAEAN